MPKNLLSSLFIDQEKNNLRNFFRENIYKVVGPVIAVLGILISNLQNKIIVKNRRGFKKPPIYIGEYIDRMLLEDRKLVAFMGQRARRTVVELFSLSRC